MQRSAISFLKLNNQLLFLLIISLWGMGCAGGKYTPPINNNTTSFSLPKTISEKQLFACQINGKLGIKKYSFSGLLLVKTMEDNSTRVTFQNEMGLTYFDFSWDSANVFEVVSIMEKMNKAPLIATLQKDFEVILRINKLSLQKDETTRTLWHRLSNGFVVYEMEAGDKINKSFVLTPKYKKVVSYLPQGSYSFSELPTHLIIQHHKANFDIVLQKLTLLEE